MTRTLTVLMVLALSACGWNHLPDQNHTWLDTPLWDAAGAVATTGGVYVRLPAAGELALVQTDGSSTIVDTGVGEVTRLLDTPDDGTVAAFVERTRCDLDDPDELAKIELVADCPYDARETITELLIVRDGAVDLTFEVGGAYNSLAWSDDGRYAIAYLDFSEGLDTEDMGIVNLTSILVLDTATGDSQPVTVGFAANRVLFSPATGDGNSERALVLSQSSVAVIDLTGDVPTTEVTFPLALDADQKIEPVGVQLTPSGQYALISVEGSGDLYVLDLDAHTVNIVSLPASPAAMHVDPETDQTVLVYNNQAVVDVLDHELFDVESVGLDEPMNHIHQATDFALLYNTRTGYDYHDVYRLDLETGNLLEYRAENPVLSLHVAPTEEYAIALTRAEGGYTDGLEGYYDRNPGMEILDLRDPDKARSTPYLLEAPAVGLAYHATATALYALVLQDQVDYLYQFDLYTGAASELELSAAPVAIGSLPDGGFFITHPEPTGLISFYDPETQELAEARGFAVTDLFADQLIYTAEEGE